MFGHEGGLWFTEFNANKIGFRTSSGEMQEFALSTGARPMGISSDLDGRYLVYTMGYKSNR